ncbi:MAG: mannose-1-phosphate guanylyltransferase [Bacteroidaceae bacterium]|nr:mannose-1-phosphate guanylyltransferase [Bacteroidaceae bacterium]
MSNNNHVVIMAGGIGSRFWPMSTPECPKQFIDVMGCGRTLIQLTVDRFRGICDPEHVWVVTSEQYLSIVKEQLPEIPVDNILAEPCRRNTAPCIAYVAWKIQQRYPDANIVVTPSDALVLNTVEFQRVVSQALNFTAQSNAIVTIGIRPSRPETGYGYIAAGNQLPESEICKVEQFKEKPNLDTAKAYLAAGNYLWNAGIFVWNVNTIVSSISAYQPDLADIFNNIAPSLYTPAEAEVIANLFPTCPNISIDYAVMEKSPDIYVHPADFGWSDLGTWGSLHTHIAHDDAGNATVGNVKLFDSANCIVHAPQNRRVVVQGLDGYIVAEKDNTLLICKLDQEQRIKDFSAE